MFDVSLRVEVRVVELSPDGEAPRRSGRGGSRAGEVTCVGGSGDGA